MTRFRYHLISSLPVNTFCSGIVCACACARVRLALKVQLANLCPEDAEEAKNLIPSLQDKLDHNELDELDLEEIVQNLQAFRSFKD